MKACSGAGFCASPFLSAAGISLADDWRALGMRATDSRAIVLDKVFVPDDAIALRRPRGQFHPVWNVILTVPLPLIMSVTPALQRLRQVKATSGQAGAKAILLCPICSANSPTGRRWSRSVKANVSPEFDARR